MANAVGDGLRAVIASAARVTFDHHAAMTQLSRRR